MESEGYKVIEKRVCKGREGGTGRMEKRREGRVEKNEYERVLVSKNKREAGMDSSG